MIFFLNIFLQIFAYFFFFFFFFFFCFDDGRGRSAVAFISLFRRRMDKNDRRVLGSGEKGVPTENEGVL